MNWLQKRTDEWKRSTKGGGLHTALGMSPDLCARWFARPSTHVFGMDEVGYGALAGPLVIGAVLAPIDWAHPLLRDSKAFKNAGNDGRAERSRALVLEKLPKDADVLYFLHRTEHTTVDRLGVFKARLRAFSELCQFIYATRKEDILVVVDGKDRIPGLEHVALPKADSFVPQVMAASIIAKVARDTEMRVLSPNYPAYDFGRNKGYNSPLHEDALKRLGRCPIHRKSYKLKFLGETGSSSPTTSA